ncbi:hypothetical protein PMM47T1_13880 [Pseudomonas sp. M47T1]|uniref:hypothetical protein n=1 Tax=Pseudomonas sp. M47T1 TaxID=1179778 RepID=UPI00026085EB|nr:hypothetical protein [Pseudomonas sp. M47T1]EIK96054.1 hypothetical protein PMM47T1_13880 [Pseudomonas sp. M47T1]
MSEPLRILPPKGQESFPVFLASGHSVRVHRIDPTDARPGSIIPSKFHKSALKEGCIYVGTEYEGEEEGDDAGNLTLIVAGIEAIIERDAAEDMDNTGRPTLKAIKVQVGFNVTRAQLNAAWDSFQESLA